MTDTESQHPAPKPRWRRLAKRSGYSALAFVLLTGGYFGMLQVDGNIRTVDPGRLYRSAQLDSSQFARVITQDGIKTIINLRGAHPTADWYETELAVSKAMGVTHYDYGISAEHIVSAAQIDSILALLRAAPKPILVHCQGGADRSGLVSALYEAVMQGKPPAVADDQLALRYGHFPYLGSKTIAMDKSFWAYVNTK
jgi:protein tyrosine/serine phosphatase